LHSPGCSCELGQTVQSTTLPAASLFIAGFALLLCRRRRSAPAANPRAAAQRRAR